MPDLSLPVCNALWLGGDLSPLEAACLSSFVRHGHRVVLHVYGKVGRVPAGVETVDGTAILPAEKIIRYKHSGGSLALFSNLFRYELLRRGKGLWIDCDMYCVRPIAAEDLHVYGWESEASVNNAILGLPPDSPLLARMLRLFDEPSVDWPWIREEDRAKLVARQAFGEVLTVGDLPWGSTGPLALTYCLRESGLIGRAASRHVYYPLLWNDAPLLGRADVDIASIVRPETLAVHLWHSRVTRHVRQLERGSPLYRLFTTGTLFEDAAHASRGGRAQVDADNASARSILLVAHGWDEEAWRAPLAELVAPRRVYLRPEVRDPSEIAYALVWNPPPGTFEGLTNLRAVFSLGAGVDSIVARTDLPDVPLVRIVDRDLTQRMIEWVTLQVLMHHRGQRRYDRAQAAHRWQVIAQPTAREVRVGIMGMGVLGRAVADALAHLGYDVAGWSTTRHDLPGVRSFAGSKELASFLGRTDILVALLPLTRQTKGALSMPLFRRLARDGKIGAPVLVNAGRGGLQVESDILAALDAGILGGASLDVFEKEPLDPASPLWDRPDVVITPHASANSYPAALAPGIASQIAAFERGEPLRNVVDRARGY